MEVRGEDPEQGAAQEEEMKTLYEPYPESVVIDGKEYPIVTDFREWIKFHDMTRDPELTQQQVFGGMMQFYYERIPQDIDLAVAELLAFYAVETVEEVKKRMATGTKQEKKKPLYDYAYDSGCILAGFYQAYRIDLERIPYLHWHKFRALLENLPEQTEFRQRIMYRNTDAGKIKDKKERQRVMEIQKRIALPSPAPTVEEIGGLFW